MNKKLFALSAHPFRIFGILMALFAMTRLADAADALWKGTNNVSATTNWSDSANWSATPFQNAARFEDSTGVTDATINNVVNDNENPSSLTYTNFNTRQNTLIAPGQKLTVSTGGLAMGNTSALPSALTPATTISGAGGTLVVSNGNVTVGQSFPSTSGSSTLDLSGLDTLIATNVSRVLAGSGASRMAGRLYLAKTNYINTTGSSPAID